MIEQLALTALILLAIGALTAGLLWAVRQPWSEYVLLVMGAIVVGYIVFDIAGQLLQ